MAASGLKEARTQPQLSSASPPFEPSPRRSPLRPQGSKLMMLGSADAAPSAPTAAVVFLEDLPEADQARSQVRSRASFAHLASSPASTRRRTSAPAW